MSLRQPENPSITLPPYVIRLERENARLREDFAEVKEECERLRNELSLANGTIESRDRNIATLQEELAKAKWESAELLADNVKHNDALGRQIYRAEQAEARALVMEKDNQESAT